jgi:hypothetical protein
VKGRLLIIDPVCALPYGHNAQALAYFRKYFLNSGIYSDVLLFGSNQLPTSVASAYGIIPFFDFLYSDVISIPLFTYPQSSPRNPMQAGGSKLSAAVSDFLHFFAEYNVTSGDALFLPSADFYAIGALSEIASRQALPSSLKLLLRLIGVMERTTTDFANPEETFLEALGRLLRSHEPVRLSSEAPVYANFLAATLKAFVHVTPYPLVGDLVPLPDVRDFRVFCGGTARIDKGYLRLDNIASLVYEKRPQRDVRFFVQPLPPVESYRFVEYTRNLISQPGVELVNDRMTAAELASWSAYAHAFLMPYDKTVYRFRGSAMLMEAIAYGRQVITEASTGYAPQVEYYGAGTLCQTDQEYADAIVNMAALSREELSVRGLQARERLAHDVDGVYRSWMA